MSTFRLNCGCLVEFVRGVERVVTMCDCCESEFDERHERAVEDRRRDVVPVQLLARAAAAVTLPDDVQ